MSRARFTLAAAGCALLCAAATAPSAFAGRVSYAVPPGPGYTVTAEGHGNGIVKVTITQCLVAGQTFQLPLQVRADGPYKGAPSAAWKVMKDGSAQLAFSPSPVTFDSATKSAVLSITAGTPRNAGDFIRFKLAPTPGSGLGEGPGYMVRYACVLAAPAPGAAAPACPRAASRDKGGVPNDNASDNAVGRPTPAPAPAPAGNGGNSGTAPNNDANGNSENSNGRAGEGTPGKPASPPDDPVCPGTDATTATPAPGTTDDTTTGSSDAPQPVTPTANTIVTTSSHQARCISTPQSLRVTAGEQNVIRVLIRQNGINISGALVRITTPDGNVFHRTGRDGTATFRVRPSKTGAVTVRSDVCFGVRRAVVHRPRVTGRHLTPAFTG